MSREEFLNMMDGRIPAERTVIGELSGLTELFPWFQGAHLLLLKALKDSGDFRFDTQLRTSAVYISDREHLYYYLRDAGKNIFPPVTPAEKIQADNAEENITDRQSGAGEEPAAMTSEAVPPFADAEEPQGLQEEPEKEPAVNLVAAEVYETQELAGYPVLIPGDAETDEAPGIMLITDEVTDAVEGTGDIAILDSDSDIEEDAELLELIEEDEPEVVAKSRRDMQFDLIDRFIIANPRIEPKREHPGQPAEDLSQPSGVESGTFVTETLAHIYIQQGYYSRAIDIYEKLSLKYPEKSSYFAAQIEKVKEYLKK
ncbi:MAG: hypothetical protein MUD02_04135 [Bacteroidales bacterium]|nr:hypothetical protein [Bacteroidales bacterium]